MSALKLSITSRTICGMESGLAQIGPTYPSFTKMLTQPTSHQIYEVEIHFKMTLGQ